MLVSGYSNYFHLSLKEETPSIWKTTKLAACKPNPPPRCIQNNVSRVYTSQCSGSPVNLEPSTFHFIFLIHSMWLILYLYVWLLHIKKFLIKNIDWQTKIMSLIVDRMAKLFHNNSYGSKAKSFFTYKYTTMVGYSCIYCIWSKACHNTSWKAA